MATDTKADANEKEDYQLAPCLKACHEGGDDKETPRQARDRHRKSFRCRHDCRMKFLELRNVLKLLDPRTAKYKLRMKNFLSLFREHHKSKHGKDSNGTGTNEKTKGASTTASEKTTTQQSTVTERQSRERSGGEVKKKEEEGRSTEDQEKKQEEEEKKKEEERKKKEEDDKKDEGKNKPDDKKKNEEEEKKKDDKKEEEEKNVGIIN